jgi:hypothetical protein
MKQAPCIAILNQQKCHFFHLQNGITGDKTGSAWGVDTSTRGENAGRGCRRVNMVHILCTHICKWKNDTCFNYSRNGGMGDNRE